MGVAGGFPPTRNKNKCTKRIENDTHGGCGRFPPKKLKNSLFGSAQKFPVGVQDQDNRNVIGSFQFRAGIPKNGFNLAPNDHFLNFFLNTQHRLSLLRKVWVSITDDCIAPCQTYSHFWIFEFCDQSELSTLSQLIHFLSS